LGPVPFVIISQISSRSGMPAAPFAALSRRLPGSAMSWEGRLGRECRKGNPDMRLNRETFESDTLKAWEAYMLSLEKSIELLETDVEEAAGMASACTREWCAATEHVIDELGNALFSISEPRWSPEENSNKIKALKRRLHDLYARYRGIASPN